MLHPRAALSHVLGVVVALLALSSTLVDGVANCNDCTGGKTCLLEDKSYALGPGASTVQVKFCNFDTSKQNSYALTFSLKKPLGCDPNGTLMPVMASLKPKDGCSPTNCIVDVQLKQSVDWALLLKNDNDVGVLQAKLGSDEVVQVAQGTADAGAAAIVGTLSNATVCTTSFGIKASRLSQLATCNKVTLCRGKPADTACTTPVSSVSNAVVKDVSCQAENCSGAVTFDGGLPCDAATGDNTAVLVSIQVGNSANSNFASIATLTAASAATISSVSGAYVGSTAVMISSTARCPSTSLNATVDGLPIKDIKAANGSVSVTLTSPLASADTNLDVSVAQCGLNSQFFTVTVAETGMEASLLNGSTKNSSATGANVGDGKPTGTRETQKEDASTGLPYGLYIGIGVGVLAIFGFAFECAYHRRRHSKEHGSGEPAV